MPPTPMPSSTLHHTRQRAGRPVASGAAVRSGDRPARASAGRHRPALETHARLDARTYFLVLENVTRLFQRDRASQLPEIDAVIDIALARAESGRASVVNEDRYEAWVSVLCRNAYLNFIRSRRDQRLITDFDSVHDPRRSLDSAHDAPVVHEAILAAIERLPRFLRDVAHMRFVEQCSHRTISHRTGRSLPITRAYANKAATRLRNDRQLKGIAGAWRR